MSIGLSRATERVSKRRALFKHPLRSAKMDLAVSVLIVVLFLVSSVPIGAVVGIGPWAAEQRTSSGNSENAKHPSHPTPSWNGHSWNWTQMADESGFVNVLISIDESSYGDVPKGLGNVLKASTAESDYSSAIDDFISHGKLVERGRFSLAFEGYSARLTVDVLEALVRENQNIQIYPDLPVNATVSDNNAAVGADVMWSRVDSSGRYVTGEGITIAVIDTGVDYTHPDLGGGFGPGFKVIGGYDFYNNDGDPMDDNGHGTHVAGIIAANGAISGVAPDSKILAYKALGSDGSGMMSTVISAIERSTDPNNDGSTDDHADVISMSLGGSGDQGDPICLAVKSAVDAGVVVVVAAGNEGPAMGTVASPGIAPEAITVGAVDNNGVLASFSSRGTSPDYLIKPEISAPGVSIYSTVPFGSAPISSPTGYATLSGTSMATPHVSGAAALMLQMHPGWTPTQVKSALVSGASLIDESLWSAGSGGLWLPGSVDATLFSSEPVVSYGSAGSVSVQFTLTNLGPSGTISITTQDSYSLTADGSNVVREWTNFTTVSPSYVTLSSGGSGTLTINVPVPQAVASEGFYDGSVVVSDSSRTLRVPLGFAILSRLNVHVIDTQGDEVFDPYGGVWVYSLPDADMVFGMRSGANCVPPASFLLPSGDYSVHAIGHQLIYVYNEPYLLSQTFSIEKLETRDIYLQMSSARQLTINLITSDGNPIWVKDFRIYLRHAGSNNISFHQIGTDYFVTTPELASLPKSKTIYVSDTSETVGIAISGFSYSAGMWSFVSRNCQHWFESTLGSSTGFYIESSADLQYLLSWEFDGIDASTPNSLDIVDGQVSVYDTKYELPGTLATDWFSWDTRLSKSSDSTFYVRRDTQTPINYVFSGLTRRTYVQGVFSELYYAGSLYDGYSEAQYYLPDYAHVLHADTPSAIYLPDRNYLDAIPNVSLAMDLGSGPFYPSLYTANTNTSLVLFQPLLRDQSGAKVGGVRVPRLDLYWDGAAVGTYMLVEYRARPDAMRIIDLSMSGFYTAKIDFDAAYQINSQAYIELGFRVPGIDTNPPVVTGMSMEQRFVPGDAVPVVISAQDDRPGVSVTLSWRSSHSGPWTSLPIMSLDEGIFSSSIQTAVADELIDLNLTVTDSSGNYLRYVASSAAMKQIPVLFDISASPAEVEFRDGDVTVLLTGRMTDQSGNALSPNVGVPLELMVGSRKVGMVLDEFVQDSSHTHNGSIRFPWVLNPSEIFSGPNEVVDLTVAFDLGLYQPVTRTFQLTSVQDNNEPPTIQLLSPSNGSLIASGASIDFVITDDGAAITARCAVDGGTQVPLSAPWDLSTAGWSDGVHSVDVYATDDEGASNHSRFIFDVDATGPLLAIQTPRNGSLVPAGAQVLLSVSDAHLADVSYSVDGGSFSPILQPFVIETTAWSIGSHSVSAQARDTVGHVSYADVTFEIANSTVVVALDSPSDGAVVKSGVPISLSVDGLGSISCLWTESGISHILGVPYEIPTDGWSETAHHIVVNASNDLGGSYEISFTITIDDTPPSITLVSPNAGSFVTPSDSVTIHIGDQNFVSLTWEVWGVTRKSSRADQVISLSIAPSDGYFHITVTALDLAGNEATSLLVFIMDSTAPRISIIGLDQSNVTAPGAVLTATAEDDFLSSFAWSLDIGPLIPLTSPASIDTSLFSLGWHTLKFVASDFSGKRNYTNISLFVDGTAPTVSMDIPPSPPPGTSLEVHVNASDDFGVRSVMLYWSTPAGGLVSVQMSLVNSSYVATISAGDLRNGTILYAIATDLAGNSGRTANMTINLSATPPGGEPFPGTGGNDPRGNENWLFGFPLLSNTGLIILGSMVGLIALLMILLPRRSERRHRAPRPMTLASGFVIMPRARPLDLVPGPSSAAQTASASRVFKPGQALGAALQKPIDEPETPLRARPKMTLLDAIPQATVKAPTADAETVDDTDYGELIERELVVGALKRSVFRDEPQITDFVTQLEMLSEIAKGPARQPKKIPNHM